MGQIQQGQQQLQQGQQKQEEYITEIHEALKRGPGTTIKEVGGAATEEIRALVEPTALVEILHVSQMVEDVDCSICLSSASCRTIIRLLPCKHAFHWSCFYQWWSKDKGFKWTCPLCRTSFQREGVTFI